MSKDDGILRPEDYKEPICPLGGEYYGMPPKVQMIPQQRIIEKMDEYMSRRDYAGAERHLLYWLEEARLGGDEGGELLVRNELVGHYRKTGEKEKAIRQVQEALELLPRLGFADGRTAGTTYVNCATALNAFGENDEAITLFEKAEEAYRKMDPPRPDLLGGLYNNRGLAAAAAGRFEEAFASYEKAMATMKTVPGGRLETAITLLNMAEAHEKRDGLEAAEKKIEELLDEAFALLKNPDASENGYYAFVLEKCAPTFSYYGYFLMAKELTEISERVYAKVGETQGEE